MKYRNAQLSSKTQLVERLLAGERFYLEEIPIYYGPQHVAPFRYGYSPLEGGWGCWADMEIDCAWYRDIQSPVMCWVDDGDPDRKIEIRLIKGTVSKGRHCYYLSVGGAEWKYATPVVTSDLPNAE